MLVGFRSDKGILRSNNEDACYVLLPDRVYVVADGVGGGNSGEIASRTAVNEIANYVTKHPISLMNNKYAVVNYLQAALEEANVKIYNLSTAIVIYIAEGKAYIANIGDSRVYLYRRGKLVQLTEDHTYVNSLVKAGVMSKEQADSDERKNVIVKALGVEPGIEPDFFQIDVYPDDILLACTDGLYEEVKPEEMIEIIESQESMSDLAKELVVRANRNGGRDNITIISLKVTEEDMNEQ